MRHLTAEQITTIREAYRQPGATAITVARDYNISLGTAYKYLRGIPATKIMCPVCGLQTRRVKDPNHYRSVLHRQAKRIRALLAENCLTFQEIGKRVGVSRERVRQIALTLGVEPGFERMKVCTIRRRTIQRATRRKQRAEQLIHPALATRFAQHDISIDGLDRQTFSYRGRTVQISQISLIYSTSPFAIVKYAHIRSHAVTADYLLIYVIPKDECYIAPRSWLPKSVYIPYGRVEGYNGGHHQRDWSQWLERWDLLTD